MALPDKTEWCAAAISSSRVPSVGMFVDGTETAASDDDRRHQAPQVSAACGNRYSFPRLEKAKIPTCLIDTAHTPHTHTLQVVSTSTTTAN